MKIKKVIRLIVILLLVAAAVVFLCYKLYKKNSVKVVDVYPVSTLSIPDYEDNSSYLANVTKGKIQDIVLREGLVNEIRVKENDTVKEGDVLMVYDKTALNLSLNSDRARIALLESQIERSNREIAKLNNLIPSEYAPSESEETIDHGKLKLVRKLTASDCKKNNQVFKCSLDTVIKADYLKELRKKKYSVTLEIYEEDALFGYYLINGKEIPKTIDVYEKYDPDSKKQNSLTAGTAEALPASPALFVRYILLDGEEPTIVPTPEPTETAAPEPTETVAPEPTETVEPEPTETVEPEPTETVEPEPTETVEPEPTETVEPEPTETVEPEPTETVEPEPTETVEPEPTETVTPKPSETMTPTPSATPTPSPTPTPGLELYVKVKADPLSEDWVLSDIVSFNGSGADVNLSGEKNYYGTFSSTMPEYYERYETIYHFPDYGWDTENYVYSKKELAQMIEEVQKDIESLQIDLRSARLTYEQDQLISETGEVKAAIDGTVTKVADLNAVAPGESVITVKGAENYMVSVFVPEMNLPEIKPGDLFTGTAYESGNMFTAVVTEIGTTPTENYFWSDTNPNSSTYPVTAAVVETDIEMSIGEMCEVRPEQEEAPDSEVFLIPNMFIRSDERGSYVYVAQNDLLAKKYIQIGKSLWGSYSEIKAGISQSDHIAFPYGKGVTDGSPIQISENFYY